MRVGIYLCLVSLIILSGCYTTHKVRVSTDIDKNGKDSYKASYEVEF
jgi:hypothetical protein